MTQTLLEICAQCDGLRVDMAMLAINRIFHATWSERAGQMPAEEFWPGAIRQVKEKYPETLLIAEAYWDTERELHGLGFDCCYDKLLYDDLRDENLIHLSSLLGADAGYQSRLVRFTENHDENRAAGVFPEKKLFAANLATYTLPGARLFHQGQLEGAKTRLPVLLGRRPDEEADETSRSFYRRLLELLGQPAFHDGSWSLCQVEPACSPLFAWTWQHATSWWLVAVNLSGSPEEAVLHLPNREQPFWEGTPKLWMTSPGESHKLADKISDNSPISLHLNEWGYLVAEITLLKAVGRQP